MKQAFWAALAAVAVTVVACDGGSGETKTVQLTPSSPSGTPSGSSALASPSPDAPAENGQLTTLRPTLAVRNSTSSQSGSRTYEFQVSDDAAFPASGGAAGAYFAVAAGRAGVAEDASGRTSYTVETDLQPATKFYWRARASQGGVVSAWSATAIFRTAIVGYNRPGELYDPLVGGTTVGERVGATTFVTDKGLRLDSPTSYVRYRLPQTVTAGEFSMEVEGLRPNFPVPSGFSSNKPKVFGMQDGDGDYNTNNWRADGQYRGLDGNPSNCIQFKALFGGEQFKIEPDTAVRSSMVFLLDPSKAYFWKASWSSGFRLQVSDGIGGFTFYDQALPAGNAYNPPRHVAYLGAPVGSGGEMAAIAGATYRSVWLSTRPRPASLGSALVK